MSTEKTEPTLTTDSTEEERSAAHAATRRKLLKAGIAGAPVIITLRSGTAWAISSCVDRVQEPLLKEQADGVIEAGRDNIIANLGVTTQQVDTVKGYPLSHQWPPANEKELYYLQAYSPSCYASFCDSASPSAGNCII